MFRPPDPDLYTIHVRFELIPDEEEKRRLKGIATRLQLSKPEVDALVSWARQILRDSQPYKDLVERLRAGKAAAAPVESSERTSPAPGMDF
jgi:hypothetical protein